MMTPQKIQDLADPIESIYIAMTNELLVNIGKHVSSPTWTHTAAWEIQKLSELGQLTAENAAIINKYIKAVPQEIRDTMEETRRVALDQIEKQLDKAAKKGYVTPPERDSTVDVLAEYSQQAANKLNLVNTTMLQSSVEQYERLVALTDAEYLRLMGQREATQEILNQAAGNVAVGTETRKTALQRAIRRISEEGLTGFYDKAGRSWSPEAYVNMDIRTTVHNVAIQSVKNRMADYNTSVFQVSAHAGARPLCYPYQGKLYSWDNTEGDIEIGTGATMHYKPLNSTSYGQPAGLFGINCGHSPIPIIPGVTIPHAQDYVQPKEENDKAYAESQEQRALEREIRAAKRAVEMGDDSKEAKDRVKEAQAAMREFIDRTGRTRRYDRESLYGGKPAEKTEKTEKVNSQLTGEKSFADKINDIKANIVGNPTADQIKEAGRILADEYKQEAARLAATSAERLKELQTEMNELQAKADAITDKMLNYNVDLDPYARLFSSLPPALVKLDKERAKIYELIDDKRRQYQHINASKSGTQAENVAWLGNMIKQVREIGAANPDDVAAHLNNSRSPVRKALEYAYSYYPRDWVQDSISVGRLTPKKVDRGFYSHWRREIAISGWSDESQRETSFHELGHRFERVVGGILENEKAFYNERTAGEQLQWLGPGYDRTEVSRFDKFLHKYMGKDYGGSAYELVSMGFEYAYTAPDKLAKDEDMQSWVYGLLLLK